MAEDNIRDFVTNWIVIGLLAFSLMTFAITFMYHNNPLGFGDTQGIFDNTTSGLSTNLGQTDTDSNVLMNITANTNPEKGQLGSRDSVSAAFGMKNTGTNIFKSIKLFLYWILQGDAGKMLVSIFSGLLGFLLVYYIYKFVRTGF